jgi:hypothetical protein
MRRDNTSSVQSFTDDILKEVADSEVLEKTASDASRLDFKTESARFLVKTAQEMRELAASNPEISYDDMNVFMEKMGGFKDALRDAVLPGPKAGNLLSKAKDAVSSVAGKAANLYKNVDSKPGAFSSFSTLDNLRKQNAAAAVGKVGNAVKDTAVETAKAKGKDLANKAAGMAMEKAKTLKIPPKVTEGAKSFGSSVLKKLQEQK